LNINYVTSSFLRKINLLLTTGYNTTVVNIKINSRKLYGSIGGAARDLETSHSTLLNYINTNKLYKDIYQITRKARN